MTNKLISLLNLTAVVLFVVLVAGAITSFGLSIGSPLAFIGAGVMVIAAVFYVVAVQEIITDTSHWF